MYTYRWVSLLVWLYFTEGVVRATGDRGPSAVLAQHRGRAVPAAVRRLRGACALAPARGAARHDGAQRRLRSALTASSARVAQEFR